MIKDKVAIITGGTGGLGIALAKTFLYEGAKVVITGRDKEKLDNASKELSDLNKEFLPILADVSKEDDVIFTFQKTVEKFSTVDILINNAGIGMIRKLVDTTLEEWNKMFAINLTGVFLMSREAVKFMVKNKIRGKIINISSVSGKSGGPMITAYSASKGGVIAFSGALAKEVAPCGINVNSICPGAMDTDMFQKDVIDTMAGMFNMERENLIKSTLSAIPLKRLLNPDEVAGLALYLASDRANGITGQAYNIDCGYYI